MAPPGCPPQLHHTVASGVMHGCQSERAFRQYDLCEPENRLVARELEGRWNQQLRALAELEAEYRRERDRGLSPLTEDERALLGRLVGDVPALWTAPETTMEDRKRLV